MSGIDHARTLYRMAEMDLVALRAMTDPQSFSDEIFEIAQVRAETARLAERTAVEVEEMILGERPVMISA